MAVVTVPTMPLLDSAHRLGRLTWYSRQAFCVFGAWARDDHAPQWARMFATLGNQHGEHAAACVARLPTITLASGEVLTPERFIDPPTVDDEAFVEALADGPDPAARRAHAEQMVARIAEIAAEHRADVDPLLDEPTSDLLDHVTRRLHGHLAVLAAGRLA
jgi:hypothetical protein